MTKVLALVYFHIAESEKISALGGCTARIEGPERKKVTCGGPIVWGCTHRYFCESCFVVHQKTATKCEPSHSQVISVVVGHRAKWAEEKLTPGRKNPAPKAEKRRQTPETKSPRKRAKTATDLTSSTAAPPHALAPVPSGPIPLATIVFREGCLCFEVADLPPGALALSAQPRTAIFAESLLREVFAEHL